MSTIKANNIQTVNGQTYQGILQVKQSTIGSGIYLNSTSWIDVTGMSVIITPYFSTSKILVVVNAQWAMGSGHGGFRLVRNGTYIALGDAVGTRTQATTWGYSGSDTNSYDVHSQTIYYLDSPATTAATTYKLQYASPYSGSYYAGLNYISFNDGDATWSTRTFSTITAMEVAQ